MSAHRRPPVADWATDFDHTDSDWVADPYPIWDKLRRTCPVAHSARYGGTWLPVRHEDVAAVDYARHIPLRVIIGMLGFPQEDADIFRRFIRMVLEDVDQSEEERQEVIVGGEIDEYIDARIAEHQAEPRDDLTTFLLEAELDGNKLQPEHVRGTMVLLMIAGIDTTWSAIGASLWHLAQHPDDRKRLATDPELIDTAVEEFLRAYAPVTR